MIPAGDRLLSSIMKPGQTRLSLMMTDTDAIRPAPPPANAKIRVFNVARPIWKRPEPRVHSDLDYKGTDVLLEGVKRFAERHGGRIELVLVRKGLHVAETLDLVNRLGLREAVTWLGEMSQKEVLEQYRLADIVTDQLATSFIGMGGLDAMAAGRPVIANGRAEISGSALGHNSPICQAANEAEVAAQLERLVLDPEERRRVGKLSREYVEEHLSTDSAAKIIAEILSAGVSTADSVRARST
jgi:glycosyltransferase involved in cell wall biosynthesis